MQRSPNHLSAFLLAAALSPVMLQSSDCSAPPGNTNLSSIEVIDGADLVIGFRPDINSYVVGTTPGADMITVRVQAESATAKVSYYLPTNPVQSGSLGFGSGEVDLDIPPDTPITLQLDVVAGRGADTYLVSINEECDVIACDDANACSVDTCDGTTAICQFSALPDLEICDEVGIVDGLCNAGRCESTSRLVDFESFTVDDQNARFGVDGLDRYYEGFDWAYDDPNKIADSSCTTATLNPPACWGSWAIDDVGSTGVMGADGSDNWLRARASGIGKGAKITDLNGFVFVSMMLFTRDTVSYPAFRDQITVTTRDMNDVDISVVVDLQAETWIEVTADDLGVGGVTLKAIWFNAAGVTSPNSGKFGLDDFKVAL